MATELGWYALKIDLYIYYFNLSNKHYKKKKKNMNNYGELEVFQKLEKITDLLTLDNCSFNWTSLKKILKRFHGN